MLSSRLPEPAEDLPEGALAREILPVLVADQAFAQSPVSHVPVADEPGPVVGMVAGGGCCCERRDGACIGAEAGEGGALQEAAAVHGGAPEADCAMVVAEGRWCKRRIKTKKARCKSSGPTSKPWGDQNL